MRIRDWSSDLCPTRHPANHAACAIAATLRLEAAVFAAMPEAQDEDGLGRDFVALLPIFHLLIHQTITRSFLQTALINRRSEEQTSELQSLMRNSYAVFCLKKKKHTNT